MLEQAVTSRFSGLDFQPSNGGCVFGHSSTRWRRRSPTWRNQPRSAREPRSASVNQSPKTLQKHFTMKCASTKASGAARWWVLSAGRCRRRKPYMWNSSQAGTLTQPNHSKSDKTVTEEISEVNSDVELAQNEFLSVFPLILPLISDHAKHCGMRAAEGLKRGLFRLASVELVHLLSVKLHSMKCFQVETN